MAGKVQQQVEYYFSEANLGRDDYLRSLMDSNGWIPMEAIVNFPRMRQLRATAESVSDALCFSDVVEVSEDKSCIRVRAAGLGRAHGVARPAPPAARRSTVLADMGLQAPAVDSSPPRQANAQVVVLTASSREGLRVLIQLRSMRMPCMPGHLGTIGGCRDRTDPDSRHTAMREVVEETGLSSGVMYPPVKFAEGAKVDWFGMQLQNPEFRGKQDLCEVDDIRAVLDRLPPSATPAECFGHAWVRVSELDGIDPNIPLMGGMLWKIQQAVDHLQLRGALTVGGTAEPALVVEEDCIEISSDSGGEEAPPT